MGATGVEALCSGLQKNTSLLELLVAGNNIRQSNENGSHKTVTLRQSPGSCKTVTQLIHDSHPLQVERDGGSRRGGALHRAAGEHVSAAHMRQ